MEDWAERVWLILCLCAVAWQPSRGLARHYCAWLRSRARLLADEPASPASPAKAAHCAQWCLDNCRGAAPRLLPPSTVEIAVSLIPTCIFQLWIQHSLITFLPMNILAGSWKFYFKYTVNWSFEDLWIFNVVNVILFHSLNQGINFVYAYTNYKAINILFSGRTVLLNEPQMILSYGRNLRLYL